MACAGDVRTEGSTAITPTGARVSVRVGGVTVAETDRALSPAEASCPDRAEITVRSPEGGR